MAAGPQPSTWSRVLSEIMGGDPSQRGQPPRFDVVRQQKLAAVQAITNRPLVLYATACTIPTKIVPPQILMLDFSDKLAFADVTEQITGDALDVIVHSPGGRPEAVESIVSQLRRRFHDIRFIIPNYAKSAATMMAMSGNEIIMDPDAELGPIDPQITTMFGTYPAQSIIEQFEQGRDEIFKDGKNVPVWGPILANLAPSLLVDCRHAIDLAQRLVRDWLCSYMFAGDSNAESKAENIAKFLSNHAYFKSHSRGVTLQQLQSHGVKVKDLSVDPRLSNAVKEVYCSVDITLGNTPTVRLVENHMGTAVVRNFAQTPLSLQLQPIRTRPSSPPSPSRPQ